MRRKLRFIFEVKKRVRCSKQFLLIISNLLNLICVEIGCGGLLAMCLSLSLWQGVAGSDVHFTTESIEKDIMTAHLD